MSLHSLNFLVFFFFVFLLYFYLSPRVRWLLLLFASYAFYMLSGRPEFSILIFLLTALNFYLGISMGKCQVKAKRKTLLGLSLVITAGTLLVFKYISFFADSLRVLHLPLPHIKFILPLGLSFYTLKIMNYVIDVYRGKKTPETHFGYFALYVAFFPQLLAGPIDRATRLLPQFYDKVPFDSPRVINGLRLVLWGLFQKMVIADNLAALVNPVFDNPSAYTGAVHVIAAVFFAFQIYCDFSGYSDIAIGAALSLGFVSMKNFDRPYFAQSIPEFWRRWHISLSTWFRDYLYIPLGGNRISPWRWHINLLIVFVVSGLWHGANWTFVIWGALHGVYYILSVATEGLRNKIVHTIGLPKIPGIYKVIRIILTFLLVSFAWIFFRAETISQAVYMIGQIASGWSTLFTSDALAPFSSLRFELLVGVGSVIFLLLVHILQEKGSIGAMLARKPIWARWLVYYAGILSILFFGNLQTSKFIYFQF
jgi:D-alanyl-lipoteichoic acid acyltransferase DltB (MBOAT superfamily)